VIVSSSNTCGVADTSVNFSLNINSAPNITSALPLSQTVCAGDSVTFVVAATGTGLSYQWRKGNTNLSNTARISGVTTNTLVIDPTVANDAANNYNVIVSSSNTCGVADTSVNFSLNINSAPNITSALPLSQTVCVGDSVAFVVAASGTGLSYQWRKGNTNLSNTARISGVTSNTLVIDPTVANDDANNYNVIVSSSNTCGVADTSINFSLNINSAPNITSALPLTQTVCAGDSVAFVVAATGTGLNYQWRKGNTNLANTARISGVTTNTLVIDPTVANDAANNYNVIVSGTCANNDTSVNLTLNINTAPSIVSVLPSTQTVCIDDSVTFVALATGTGLNYQWRKGNTILSNGLNITGANSNTLVFSPVNSTDAANNYNVVISGTCANNDTSSNVALIINNPVLLTQTSDLVACIGDSINFAVTASGGGLSYQWRNGNQNLVNGGRFSGVHSNTLVINPVLEADTSSLYHVVVYGNCSSIDTSNYISLAINAAPIIITQPTDILVFADDQANVSVVASGVGLTYQWRRGTTNVVDGPNISGATTATLTIDPANISDNDDNYNVVVTNSCGNEVRSINVLITVCLPIGIDYLSLKNPVVTIFPNPFTNNLKINTIDIMSLNNTSIVIYNLLGKEISRTLITNSLTEIDTYNYPSGAYFYNVIENGKIIQSGKIISQK
jgi:hypothetical protein